MRLRISFPFRRARNDKNILSVTCKGIKKVNHQRVSESAISVNCFVLIFTRLKGHKNIFARTKNRNSRLNSEQCGEEIKCANCEGFWVFTILHIN